MDKILKGFPYHDVKYRDITVTYEDTPRHIYNDLDGSKPVSSYTSFSC